MITAAWNKNVFNLIHQSGSILWRLLYRVGSLARARSTSYVLVFDLSIFVFYLFIFWFPTAFLVLLNFRYCFYNSIEPRYMYFYFLIISKKCKHM